MCTSVFFTPGQYQIGLARGSKDQYAIRLLQQSLAYHEQILIDGDFGPKTESALKAFQARSGLTPSGVLDEPSARKLASYPAHWAGFSSIAKALAPVKAWSSSTSTGTQRRLVSLYNQFHYLIKEIPGDAFGRKDISNILYAIMVIECGPEPLSLVNGTARPIIRFENHLWWDNWGKNNPDQFYARWRFSKDKRWEGHTFDGKSFHGSQELEWASYEAAAQIDREAATESMSIGLGQVLGSHHQRLYFNKPTDLLAGYYSPVTQLLSMLDLITTDYRLVDAIRRTDWYQFAYVYNGSGKPTEYSKQLASAYTEAVKVFGA